MIDHTYTLIDENQKIIMELHPLEETVVSITKQKSAKGETKNETGGDIYERTKINSTTNS